MRKKISLFSFLFALWAVAPLFAQQQGETDPEMAEYVEQSKQLVRFLEGTLNFLGDKESITKEKEIIINESYSKIFVDSEVQIEDDLDESRETPINKDVQAYLKDIDFFFKDVKFEFTIEDAVPKVNERGVKFVQLTLNRNLNGTTVGGKKVNNNKKRYVEVNIDEENKDLKIASIYTTKLDEREDLKFWWDNLTPVWREIFRKQLGVSIVMVNEIRQIMRLKEIDVANNSQITDIQPLNRLTDLQKLDISNTKVSDLLPIRNLIDLESLNCSNTNVASFDPLKYTVNLRDIFANNTKIDNLDALQNFPKLERLYLNNTPISDISALQEMENLKDLRIAKTNVSSLEPLSNLKDLELLDCSGTKVSTLKDIENLTQLRRLECAQTQITNLEYLKNLEKLQILNIDRTQIVSLSQLDNLPELQKIYCDGTKISHSNAKEFMLAHRDVLVIYESEALQQWWDKTPKSWQKVFAQYVEFSGKPNKEQLHEIASIKKVDISKNTGIQTLEPAAMLNNLQELDCSETRVSDLTPLSNLLDLRHLNCRSTQVADLTPLSKLVNLSTLNCANTKVASLKPLRNLSGLSAVNCENSAVKSIDALKELASLKLLYTDQNGISTADVLAFRESNPECLMVYKSDELAKWWEKLDKTWQGVFSVQVKVDDTPTRQQLHKIHYLEALDVEDTKLADVEPLAQLPALKKLRFSNTDVSNIDPLKDLLRLESLEFPKNFVTSLAALKGLHRLTYLNFENNPVQSLEPLSHLKKLEELNCSGTQVKNLKGLEGLKNLKHLSFFNTKVMWLKPVQNLNLKTMKCYNTRIIKFFLKRYKDAHPKCDVVFY